MGNMRSYRRAVLRAKADRLSHYGKNGKSIKLFRMMWNGQKEAAANAPAKRKAKRDKNDKALAAALKKAKESKK